jgi:hypothetical protein
MEEEMRKVWLRPLDQMFKDLGRLSTRLEVEISEKDGELYPSKRVIHEDDDPKKGC